MNELTKLIAEFHATLAKFEVIAKRMEERESGIDPTMRDLPFPDGVIPPPLPDGKTRWIYRGMPSGNPIYVKKPRHVLFSRSGNHWMQTDYFSESLHHIEAV
jgi:hypothetical protein